MRKKRERKSYISAWEEEKKGESSHLLLQQGPTRRKKKKREGKQLMVFAKRGGKEKRSPGIFIPLARSANERKDCPRGE